MSANASQLGNPELSDKFELPRRKNDQRGAFIWALLLNTVNMVNTTPFEGTKRREDMAVVDNVHTHSLKPNQPCVDIPDKAYGIKLCFCFNKARAQLILSAARIRVFLTP